MNDFMLSDEKIISELKDGNTQPLEIIYEKHRKDFIRWVIFKFNIESELAEDAFSDAVIDLYQNIIREKYSKKENTSLKSYLFEIGKFKILNILNKNKVAETHLKRIADNAEHSYFTEQSGLAELAQKVSGLLIMLDERCRKVLTLYYYQELSMEQIAAKMEFKNQDVAKNKKLKCLKRLQSIAFGRINQEDMYE